MADTALSMVQTALEGLKVYAPGITINGADISRGIAQLNKMMDEWSNSPLACFANLEQSLVLVPGKNQYTIGTGGNLNGPRPINIRTGPGAAYLTDSNSNRYPVDVIEQDQWNMIGLLTDKSNLPDTIFYDPQYPLGLLNLYPTPSVANTLYFDSRLQLADFAATNTPVTLPPGYVSAIESNLMLRLWKFYKQGDPVAHLVEEAREALAAIKRSNIRQSPSRYDSAVVSKAKSSYNIYTDSTNSRGTP